MAGEVIRESLPFVILLHFQTVTSGLRIIHSEKPTPNIDNEFWECKASILSTQKSIYFLFFYFFCYARAINFF